MTPLQADAAVRKVAPYAYYYYGGYRFGDAASLELKYNKSGVVSGYTYILAPTS